MSVILPTWNRAAMLPRAVASVRRQTHADWELIIEDDGSTDETAHMLARMRAADARIIVCSHARMGPGAARNHGLLHATGEFTAFLDSDDEYDPEHLALRVQRMTARPHVGLLHGGARITGPESARFVPDYRNPGHRIPIDACVIGGTFFARTQVLRDGPGWPDGFGEDARLLAELEQLTLVERVTDRTYVYHREAGGRCDEEAAAHPGADS